MGGYGSGRTSGKQNAEHCKSLDVNRLRREGCLKSGSRGHWVWSLDGAETGRISYHTDERGLSLSYRFRQHGDDWESVSQTIPIAPLCVCAAQIRSMAVPFGGRCQSLAGTAHPLQRRQQWQIAFVIERSG
jgi:hypothetical protein